MLTKAERTRLYIIEKASHLFNKKGFHGTSMNDVLEATGLAKGGVYGNFKSKDELVLEAFEYAFRKVSDELTIRIKSKDNAVDKLLCIVQFYDNYLEAPTIEGGCPMLNFSSHAEASFPELQKAVQRSIKLMIESIERILEKGKNYGQIRDTVNARLVADILYSRIEGALMLAKSTQDASRLRAVLGDCKEYIMRELVSDRV